MTRPEKAGVLLVALLAGLFVAVIASGLADALGHRSWFSNGANVIQWISGPGTFAAVAVGLMAYLNRTCSASPVCLRFGVHPVNGCLKKVCAHHHTLADHLAVHDRYAAKHFESGRLGWGESHERKPFVH